MREPHLSHERLAHRPDPAVSAACYAGRSAEQQTSRAEGRFELGRLSLIS